MELYNRAYKLDPEIDRHIDHDRLASEISQRDLSELDPYCNPYRKLVIQNDPVDRELLSAIVNAKQEPLQDKKDAKADKLPARVFSLSLKEDGGKVNLLKDLPGDVLDKVLGYLGWMNLPSLEVASTASRDLFIACRQESLWKYLYEKCTGSAGSLINDPGRLEFIMGPHFRTDGLYISRITYLRQGYRESAISQPSHLVTYYRYLRFFNTPEIKGRLVVALVSPDEPKVVIERLREIDGKTLKAVKERVFTMADTAIKSKQPGRQLEAQLPCQANLFVGSYKLETGRTYKLLLFDAHSKHPMQLKMLMELGDPSKGIPSYRTTKCLEYCGRIVGGDEKIDFDTHKWGKFYFSPVKSYK